MSKTQMTPEELRAAAVKTVAAVAECIKDLGEVPSGHLYARLMGFMGIESYQAIIHNLKKAGLVKEENHLLTWIGPKNEQ